MALVQSKKRGNGSLANPRNVAAALNVLQSSKNLVDLANQLSKVSLRGQNKTNSSYDRKLGRRGRQARARESNEGSSQHPVGGITSGPFLSRGLGTGNSHRIRLKEIFNLVNGATNALNSGWTLGFSGNGTLDGLFQTSYFPKLNAVAALYSQFYLNAIRITFVPCIATTTAGTFAMGVDPDPTATFPGAYSAIVHHGSSCLTDLLHQCTITYRPTQDRKKDPRYVYNTTAGKDADEINFGVVQLYSSNTLATGGNIGYLILDADVTLIGPK